MTTLLSQGNSRSIITDSIFMQSIASYLWHATS